MMQIRGIADFIERLAGDYRELWYKYGGETCLKSFNEYLGFLQGRKKVTFIRFTNFRELENPISMEEVSKVLGVLRMPRGGKYINLETANRLIV
jgi:predicted transcriptional regulator